MKTNRFSFRMNCLAAVSACFAFLLQENVNGAVYMISGSGRTTAMGTPGGDGIFLNPTFTYQIFFDDAVLPTVTSQTSRNIATFMNAITSFVLDGVEQVNPMAPVGNEISLVDYASPGVTDNFLGFIDNANLRIEGNAGSLFSSPYSLHVLSSAFNLGSTEILRFYFDLVIPTAASGIIESASAPVLVPEPSVGVLGLIGTMAFLQFRRRRQPTRGPARFVKPGVGGSANRDYSFSHER